jgi:hypothetical protein
MPPNARKHTGNLTTNILTLCVFCDFFLQVRKYEAEVAAVNAAKERERALAEWTAEQERVATLGLLDQQEAKRQRDRCDWCW